MLTLAATKFFISRMEKRNCCEKQPSYNKEFQTLRKMTMFKHKLMT